MQYGSMTVMILKFKNAPGIDPAGVQATGGIVRLASGVKKHYRNLLRLTALECPSNIARTRGTDPVQVGHVGN